TSTAITSATEGQAYQYTVTGDDNDGDTLNWSLTTAPAGMTIDPTSGVIDWLPGEGGATAWNENVTVEVSDGTDTATQSFSITVTPVNDAPTITSTAPLSAVEGALYQYSVAVSDSDDANNGTDLAF